MPTSELPLGPEINVSTLAPAGSDAIGVAWYAQVDCVGSSETELRYGNTDSHRPSGSGCSQPSRTSARRQPRSWRSRQ